MKKVSIKNIQKKKKGFTLVELIIVIAIIAILAAMAIPKFSAIRTEGKVSNDVAAAKNIQTITATLLANGTIPVPAAAAKTSINLTDADGNAKEIKDRLDGKVASNGLSEGVGTTFIVDIDDKESISVKVGANELFPDTSGAGKKAHLTAASATPATP